MVCSLRSTVVSLYHRCLPSIAYPCVQYDCHSLSKLQNYHPLAFHIPSPHLLFRQTDRQWTRKKHIAKLRKRVNCKQSKIYWIGDGRSKRSIGRGRRMWPCSLNKRLSMIQQKDQSLCDGLEYGRVRHDVLSASKLKTTREGLSWSPRAA